LILLSLTNQKGFIEVDLFFAMSSTARDTWLARAAKAKLAQPAIIAAFAV